MKVTATIGRDHYKTVLETEINSFVADETVSNGGKSEGFTPHELMSAALASCTTITLRMYADRKKWMLEEVNASVSFVKESGSETTLACEIELKGNLSEEQRSRLLEIANLCPVHKILSNPIQLNTRLI